MTNLLREWKEWPIKVHTLDSEEKKKQARDDLRLLSAAYVKVSKGEEVKADGKSPATKEEIIGSGVAVLKSLIAANAITLHPSEWKESTKEFMQILITRLKKQGIDVPLEEVILESLSDEELLELHEEFHSRKLGWPPR
jgi:hypothetical protein